MADTDPVGIVELGPADAAAGLALSTEAHWNQNEADWRFFLTQGTVFGVRDTSGNLVATAALLPYTSGNAWISMVLVTANWRRRGLATRLVDACLAAAARQRLTLWLDATPDGAAVYGPLGFMPTLSLRRLRLAHAASPKTAALQPISTCDLDGFIARDIGAMGFDRGRLLTELGGRPGSGLLSNNDAVALVRDGRTARHIGPLFADSPDRALALVNEIARFGAGPLLIDAVSTHGEFLDGLAGSGWSIERPFQRMRFGRATVAPEGLPFKSLPFAVAGPEYG
jgi:GNAT superfamily N-acetyltransferase